MQKINLNTKPKFIKNTKISTLEFVLVFPIENKYDTYLYINLLKQILLIGNKTIPDEEEFDREVLRKNIINMYFKVVKTVDKSYLYYRISIPKEGLIKDYNLEESFQFAIYNIFNPDIKDNRFDEYKFNREKKSLYENIKRSTDGINAHNSNVFFSIIDPEDELGNNNTEKNLKLLEKIDSKKLYKFYQINILKNYPLCYVYGNITKNKVDELFNKYLPIKEKIKFNINYFKPLPVKEHKYQVINTNYSQSEILYEYQADIEEKDRPKLSIIFNILNASENKLIFQKVRIENNLVYSIFLTPFLSRAMFVIGAFIAPENIDILKKLIDEVFEELHNKEYMTECYNRLMKAMEIDLLYEEDNNYNNLFNVLYKDLKLKTTEDIIKEYKSVTIDELIEFLDKIKLTNVVFFKGGE